jgi:two-component system response regulator FixJ
MLQTVFVIDDDVAARDSLTFLMRTEGMTSRAFDSARAFLDQLHKDQRGCIVTDVRMPGMDGIALVEALGEIGCIMPIIMITGHADVPLAVHAMKAGVADFIEKPFESETILGAVRSALETAHERDTVETRRAAIERRQATLTEREGQVLSQVVDGCSNKEIAQQLGISFRTVEIYRANVMSKMQAGSLSELVRMMILMAA